jgi:hypothetical protein
VRLVRFRRVPIKALVRFVSELSRFVNENRAMIVVVGAGGSIFIRASSVDGVGSIDVSGTQTRNLRSNDRSVLLTFVC